MSPNTAGLGVPQHRTGLSVPQHSRIQCPPAQNRTWCPPAQQDSVSPAQQGGSSWGRGREGPLEREQKTNCIDRTWRAWARGLLSGSRSSGVGMGRDREQFFSRWAEKSIQVRARGLIRSGGAFPAPRRVGSPPGRGALGQSRSLPPCRRRTCARGVGTLCRCCSSRRCPRSLKCRISVMPGPLQSSCKQLIWILRPPLCVADLPQC